MEEVKLALPMYMYYMDPSVSGQGGSLPSPAPLQIAPPGPILGTHFGAAACYFSWQIHELTQALRLLGMPRGSAG